MVKNYLQYILESNGLGFEPEDDWSEIDHESSGLSGDLAKKAAGLDTDNWRKDYTSFIFALRQADISPDDESPEVKWNIDSWFRVDYSNLKQAGTAARGIKLRQRFNNTFVYAVWIPDEIADAVDENPEQYMWLLQKYKFKI